MSTPTLFRHWTATLWTVRLAQGTPVLDGVNFEDRDGLGRHLGIGSQFPFDIALCGELNERKSLSGSRPIKPLIWDPKPVRQGPSTGT